VPENIRAQAEQRAAAEGKSLSALARDALEHYLEAS
jgi:predicted HicB family RNase H-like nuclease